MSDIWYKEECPACKAINWICNGNPDDGDCSKMDVTDYTCYACKAEIRMVSGEFGDIFTPHVLGTEEFDDQDQGNHFNGLQFPI